MRLPKTVHQITKSKQTLYSFVLRQFAQAADDGRIYGKKLTGSIFLSSPAVIDLSFLPRFKRR